MPNGGQDPDCGWLEPTYRRIQFKDSAMRYELEHQSDRCGTMTWDAAMNRQ